MSILISLLGIVLLAAAVVGYFVAAAYGIYLAAKAHPAWILICLVIGPVAVMGTIIFVLTRRNIFEMIGGQK